MHKCNPYSLHIGRLLPDDHTDFLLHFAGIEDGKLVLPGNEEVIVARLSRPKSINF